MATRNIENWKERLITILVTPFTTCSARLPVYTILIALVIPKTRVFGIFNAQGLTLMLLYLLGFATAIFAAYILNKILKIKGKTFFVIEMPNYKVPIFKNVAINVLEKTKAFVAGAGKIILAISIILWFLASYGPGTTFSEAENIVKNNPKFENYSSEALNSEINSYELENSYIGIMGHAIEPAIRPLGYDWKIGIALITSFAAREVFVGTMATLYSVDADDSNVQTLRQKMQTAERPDGSKVYTLATGVSLMLFYLLAMQCMSTLAVVKRETQSWKWPIIQLLYMTGLAYLMAFVAYQVFS
jgi:ferrous iron transport protein B